MADNTGLTEQERAELEELRREKAAREQASAEARERAELDRLRAERQRNEAKAEQARRDAEARERGRALMEPDDDLRMPLGQKVVISIIALIVIAFAASSFIR